MYTPLVGELHGKKKTRISRNLAMAGDELTLAMPIGEAVSVVDIVGKEGDVDGKKKCGPSGN